MEPPHRIADGGLGRLSRTDLLRDCFAMPMRTECKHFESRSYANGDTVRKCNLNLAPEAPWRCPENCEKYERRMVDVAWAHGSLVPPVTPVEPASLDDGSAAAVLDEAASIVNAAMGGVLDDLNDKRKNKKKNRDKKKKKKK
jgi:hypothetical protein